MTPEELRVMLMSLSDSELRATITMKNNKVFDVPTWRQIQRFGTIRNLCDRNKGAEPTPQEVEELVSGVEKVTKSIF